MAPQALRQRLNDLPPLQDVLRDGSVEFLTVAPSGAFSVDRFGRRQARAALPVPLVDALARELEAAGGAAFYEGWRMALLPSAHGRVLIAERCPTSGQSPAAPGEALEAVEAQLEAGANGVVIGPPGAGKLGFLCWIARQLGGHHPILVAPLPPRGGDALPPAEQALHLYPPDSGQERRSMLRLLRRAPAVVWDGLNSREDHQLLFPFATARRRWASLDATAASEALARLDDLRGQDGSRASIDTIVIFGGAEGGMPSLRRVLVRDAEGWSVAFGDPTAHEEATRLSIVQRTPEGLAAAPPPPTAEDARVTAGAEPLPAEALSDASETRERTPPDELRQPPAAPTLTGRQRGRYTNTLDDLLADIQSEDHDDHHRDDWARQASEIDLAPVTRQHPSLDPAVLAAAGISLDDENTPETIDPPADDDGEGLPPIEEEPQQGLAPRSAVLSRKPINKKSQRKEQHPVSGELGYLAQTRRTEEMDFDLSGHVEQEDAVDTDQTNTSNLDREEYQRTREALLDELAEAEAYTEELDLDRASEVVEASAQPERPPQPAAVAVSGTQSPEFTTVPALQTPDREHLGDHADWLLDEETPRHGQRPRAGTLPGGWSQVGAEDAEDDPDATAISSTPRAGTPQTVFGTMQNFHLRHEEGPQPQEPPRMPQPDPLDEPFTQDDILDESDHVSVVEDIAMVDELQLGDDLRFEDLDVDPERQTDEEFHALLEEIQVRSEAYEDIPAAASEADEASDGAEEQEALPTTMLPEATSAEQRVMDVDGEQKLTDAIERLRRRLKGRDS